MQQDGHVVGTKQRTVATTKYKNFWTKKLNRFCSASWELDKFGRLMRGQPPNSILLPVEPISDSKGHRELGAADLPKNGFEGLRATRTFSVTDKVWIAPSGKKKWVGCVWVGRNPQFFCPVLLPPAPAFTKIVTVRIVSAALLLFFSFCLRHTCACFGWVLWPTT